MKEQIKKKKYLLTGILAALIFITAGTVFSIMGKGDLGRDEGNKETEKEEKYLALSDADRETADLYAELYEMSREEVAGIQKETGDWENTAEELEKEFFTIPENKKLQMEKEGYSLEDLQEAERLSAQTGKKAIELAEAKGKVTDNREWSEVVKDSEILTTEEQLGLTKEQVRELKDRSLEKEERVEVAVLLLNGTYTFDEVVKNLDAGKTVKDLKKEKTNG